MRVLRIILLASALVLPAVAESNAPKPRQLSLQDCIAIALQNNFDIQIKRYDPMISRFNLQGDYGAYDPNFSITGQHDYNLSPGGVDAQGRSFGGTETDTDRLGSGLNGLLPWGMNYSLGASLADQNGTRPSFDTNGFLIRSPFETTSGDVGALTLRQPLLKNFWIDSPRLTIFVDKQDLKIKEADLRDRVMSTMTDVETAYFNLIFSEESVRVQEKALELADRLLAENKRRVEVGALAPLDEKQAEAQVASSRADLLSAQGTRDSQQRVLKDLLSDNYTNDWSEVLIVPLDKLVALPEKYDLQESWRKGLAQGPRLGLQQYRLALVQQKQRIKYSHNQLFPQVDLIGSYGYNASSREFSGALDQFGGGDNPFWTFGAQLNIPLGRTSARNNYKAAKAVEEQLNLKLKQAEQKTLIQIENDIATVRTSFERVDATRQARLYAEAALNAEQKKLENGKSTSFVVLQLQKDLTSARSSEIRALADYNIALAELAFDEGSTLERRKVNLEVK